MSKREIEVVIYQCDHVDDNGERCGNDGERSAIFICCVCGKDLCKSHYELTTVTPRRMASTILNVGQYRYAYLFCIEHKDELKNLIFEKFGDCYEVISATFGGKANATGTPNRIY